MRSNRQKGDWYAREPESKAADPTTGAITADTYAPLVRAEGRFLVNKWQLNGILLTIISD